MRERESERQRERQTDRESETDREKGRGDERNKKVNSRHVPLFSHLCLQLLCVMKTSKTDED